MSIINFNQAAVRARIQGSPHKKAKLSLLVIPSTKENGEFFEESDFAKCPAMPPVFSDLLLQLLLKTNKFNGKSDIAELVTDYTQEEFYETFDMSEQQKSMIDYRLKCLRVAFKSPDGPR